MKDFAEFERSGWAQRGAGYTGGFGTYTARCVPALLDAVEPCAGRLLVDVGTGPGIAAVAATVRGAVVVGVDESAAMLHEAQRRLPTLVRACALQLPLRPAVADIVIGNCVINHLPDPAAGVAEFARVLRPGGRLALTSWDLAGGNQATALVGRAIKGAGVHPPATPANPFVAHADPAAFGALLSAAGLVDVTVTPVPFIHPVPPGGWWEAIRSGTVTTNGQLSALDGPALGRVRSAYDDLVSEYVDGEGIAHLPALAWLATGRVV